MTTPPPHFLHRASEGATVEHMDARKGQHRRSYSTQSRGAICAARFSPMAPNMVLAHASRGRLVHAPESYGIAS
eukprot:scaffold1560_cov394-Pavlova_lutheri.AAC.4